MERELLLRLTMTALDRAMEGDTCGAADAMLAIGQDGDHHDVYGACCAFAEVGKAALKKLYADQAADLSRGGMWVMQVLDSEKVDPCETFATRFIVAHANDDEQSTLALFRAALKAADEQYAGSVAALLSTAVSLARTALHHSEDPADGDGGR